MDKSPPDPSAGFSQGLTDSDWVQLHAYADGELTGADLADFERALASRPELRAAANAVDTAHQFLREAYGSSNETTARIGSFEHDLRSGQTSNRETRNERVILRRLTPAWTPIITRVAAALVLIASALAIRSYVMTSSTISPTPVVTDVAMLYDRYAGSMEPTVVCDTAPKFVRYTREAFGRRISADFDAASRAGITLVGWVYPDDSYGGDPGLVLGRRVLLAHGPGGTPVVTVFQDASWPAPASVEGLRVKSTSFGDFAAYEIGASSESVVLPLLNG